MLAKGNLLNWNDSEWQLDEGIEWREKTFEEVCLIPMPRDILIPEHRSNSESHQLCNKLRGHLTVTDSQEKADALLAELQEKIPSNFDPTATKYWAGWNDNRVEGHFENHLTGKVLREEDGFWLWRPGEPNGGTMENCATVWLKRRTWQDSVCDNSDAFAFCRIQPRPRLIMRGKYKNVLFLIQKREKNKFCCHL